MSRFLLFIRKISVEISKTYVEKESAFFQKATDAKLALDEAIHWKSKIGTRFFCHLHKIAKKSGPSKDRGKIRNRQNWIGKEGCNIKEAYFYPPDATQLRPLLKNLESFLALKTPEPVVQLAIGFAQFLIIHPFMDGNGRIARMLIPLFLFRRGLLSLSTLFL